MVAPLALMGTQAVGNMALGMLQGSKLTKPHKAADFDAALKQKLSQELAKNPADLIGKTVQVQDPQGRIITGKVENLETSQGDILFQVQGKSFRLQDIIKISS